MQIVTWRGLLALNLSLVIFGPAAAQKNRPISQAATVLSLYTEDWGLGSARGPQLIVAVWGDGHMVWSSDALHGGGTFRSAQVAPPAVSALIKQWQQEKIFGDKTLTGAKFGPDSQFTTIFLAAGRQKLKMQSWHELSEANPRMVVTSAGVMPLEGRRREEVLKQEPPDYKHYRAVWRRLRSQIMALKPASSKPVQGKLVMRHGVLSWQEESTNVQK